MLRILVVAVSVAGLAASAFCFRLDHQSAPPKTNSTITAASSPRGFMGYLLRHQPISPAPIAVSGSRSPLHQKIRLMRLPVMFRRRSSGSLGRMEIRSSSEVSQLKVLRARSRLPIGRIPRKLLVAHKEDPYTTNRPGLFGLPVL